MLRITKFLSIDAEDDKKSKKILTELENIDDECDDIGIDFVKISDEGIAQEYDIVSLPALVYFRNRFPQIYEGKNTLLYILIACTMLTYCLQY